MIPEKAIEIVQHFEGLHKVRPDGLVYPYVCPAGVWTIGWGTTRELDGTRIHAGTPPKTPDECLQLLLFEMDDSFRKALWLSPILQWNSGRLSAIISFIYNLGWPAYRASTLRKRVNAQDWEAARSEIRRWVFGGGVKLPGLVARREVEARLLV